MAFKVGQRVKRIRCNAYLNPVVPVGSVGSVLMDTGGDTVEVAWDHLPPDYPRDACWARSSLAPLTPPAVDEWAADKVRQVTKPQPVELTA